MDMNNSGKSGNQVVSLAACAASRSFFEGSMGSPRPFRSPFRTSARCLWAAAKSFRYGVAPMTRVESKDVALLAISWLRQQKPTRRATWTSK